MTALPPSSNLTSTGITKATFKAALTDLRAYLSNLLGDTGTQSAALSALGAPLNGTIAKTTTHTVVVANRGKLIDCTGTWTLGIDALATLGADFVFAVFNTGTGIITINPNLSEPINAASTFVLGPNESCVVMVNAAGDGWLAVLTGGGGGSTGQVAHFAMNTAPTGWFKANGALVSRTTYAALFSKIGTTFGVGDGSTTFALPDLRGEFVRGWDDGRGVDSGRAFGSAQADDLKSHTHTAANQGTDLVGIVTSNSGPTTAAGNTGSTGGTETRPRNIALLACIKY